MSAEKPNFQNNQLNKELREEKETARARSREKFNEVGSLGVVLQDHKNIGSTFPHQLLIDNPDKTLGELFSEKEIESFLDEEAKFKEFFDGDDVDGAEDSIEKDIIRDSIKNFPLHIKYLNSIGRLPEKYRKYLENGES